MLTSNVAEGGPERIVGQIKEQGAVAEELWRRRVVVLPSSSISRSCPKIAGIGLLGPWEPSPSLGTGG